MSTPDGREQREAEQLEREIQGGSDLEIATQLADEARDVPALSVSEIDLAKQIAGLGASALVIKMQRDALADTLRDIAIGAEMMLEPVMGATGAFKRFAEEIKRVARAGLKEAQV
jgi:hypothetical protein